MRINLKTSAIVWSNLSCTQSSDSISMQWFTYPLSPHVTSSPQGILLLVWSPSEVNIGDCSFPPLNKTPWTSNQRYGTGIKLGDDTPSTHPSQSTPRSWLIWDLGVLWSGSNTSLQVFDLGPGIISWGDHLPAAQLHGTTGWGNKGSVYNIKFLKTWGGVLWTLHQWSIFQSAALSTWQEDLNSCHF